MFDKIKSYFSGFPLRTKLIVSTSFLLFLMVLIGFANQKMILSFKKSVFNLSLSMTSSDWLAQATAYKPEMLQNIWTAIANYNPGKGIAEDQSKDILTSADNIEDNFKKYLAEETANGNELSPKEKEAYGKLEKLWTIIKPKITGLTTALKEGKLSRDDLQKQVSTLTDECLGISDLLSELSGLSRQTATEATKQAQNLQKQNVLLLNLTAVLGLLFGAISLLIVLHTSKWLGSIANRLGAEAEEVSTASKKIAQASAILSSGTTEQASALQQTVASIEQISAMVARNAENANNSLKEAIGSLEAANSGKQTVQNMTHAIEEIQQSNTEMMTQIEIGNRQTADIAKLIIEIGEKTKVINDIVFQTKLLSFNASVEAARAGEAGKGFAVVAEEVGNLARMSGTAAQEISDMLDTSIKTVESVVTEMRSKVSKLALAGKEKVNAGIIASHECGRVLEEIVVKVEAVNQMVSEITTSSHEQASGVHEINKAITQLDQVTQQNSRGAEDTAQSGNQLTVQSLTLQEIVVDLLKITNGTHTT